MNPVLDLVKKGKLEPILDFLKSSTYVGPGIQEKDLNDNTALHIAAKQGLAIPYGIFFSDISCL